MYAHLPTNSMVREINKSIRHPTTTNEYEIEDLDKKITTNLIPNPIDGDDDAYHPVNSIITI
jgi:hypothetical protein